MTLSGKRVILTLALAHNRPISHLDGLGYSEHKQDPVSCEQEELMEEGFHCVPSPQ